VRDYDYDRTPAPRGAGCEIRKSGSVRAGGGKPPPATRLSANGAGAVPDPEVTEKPKRRRFSAEYRLRIVREADACKEPGEIGALLRREGLYSSLLTAWRRQRDAGALEGLRSKKRGPKAKAIDPRVKRLERENARLKRKLEQAETIIDIQKKVAGMLGIPLKSSEPDEKD
jgi:transposase